MKVLLAGATGYLGSHIAKTMLRQTMDFKAIARNPQKLIAMGIPEEQIIEAQLTDRTSLKGICSGFDAVISTVGITRQKDGLSYMDVDYQANKNLLEEALESKVQQFVYVSVLHGAALQHLQICAAKERFVNELKSSGMPYSIVRPSGFFSDMTEFYEMAKRGRVFLFGDGQVKVNPIHGADLPQVCLDALDAQNASIDVGGPEVMTHQAIAEAAFNSLDRKAKITYIPNWLRKMALRVAAFLLSKTQFGPVEFFLQVMVMDMDAPAYGQHTIRGYFHELKQAENTSN